MQVVLEDSFALDISRTPLWYQQVETRVTKLHFRVASGRRNSIDYIDALREDRCEQLPKLAGVSGRLPCQSCAYCTGNQTVNDVQRSARHCAGDMGVAPGANRHDLNVGPIGNLGTTFETPIVRTRRVSCLDVEIQEELGSNYWVKGHIKGFLNVCTN